MKRVLAWSAAALSLALALAVVACHRNPPEGTEAPSPSDTTGEPAKHVHLRASFPLSRIQLTVEDVHMSTRFDDVLARAAATVVVNGGFFDPKGEPLGLAVSNGKALSAFSPGMSGGVLWVRGGIAHLSATEEYEAGSVDFAVQCRPRLVVGSHANVLRSDGRRAMRTAICLRDGGRTVELLLAASAKGDGGPTLFELAQELAEDGCEEALNLDGGPSTGWASTTTDSGMVFEPPLAAVRHALVVREMP